MDKREQDDVSDLHYGDTVRIIAGVFQGFQGEVRNAAPGKYLISIDVRESMHKVDWIQSDYLRLAHRR